MALVIVLVRIIIVVSIIVIGIVGVGVVVVVRFIISIVVKESLVLRLSSRSETSSGVVGEAVEATGVISFICTTSSSSNIVPVGQIGVGEIIVRSEFIISIGEGRDRSIVVVVRNIEVLVGLTVVIVDVVCIKLEEVNVAIFVSESLQSPRPSVLVVVEVVHSITR